VLLGTVAAAQQESLKLPPATVLAFLKLVRERDHLADIDRSQTLGREVMTLKGLKGVGIIVEDVKPAVEAAGLKREDLVTDTELRLRAAGIRVLTQEEQLDTPGYPYLYVRVNAIPEGRLLTHSLAVRLHQVAYLESTGYCAGGVTTWERGSIGRTDAEKIRQEVRNRVDEFALDFLKANPK
jgi:hypothetical protein